MCVSVRVVVCASAYVFVSALCVCVQVYVYVCVCVCACVRACVRVRVPDCLNSARFVFSSRRARPAPSSFRMQAHIFIHMHCKTGPDHFCFLSFRSFASLASSNQF